VRGSPINLYDPEMFAELNVLMDTIDLDTELKVVVFESATKNRLTVSKVTPAYWRVVIENPPRRSTAQLGDTDYARLRQSGDEFRPRAELGCAGLIGYHLTALQVVVRDGIVRVCGINLVPCLSPSALASGKTS